MTRDSKENHARQGGRQIVSAALILAAALFMLPALLVRGEPVYQRTDPVDLPNGESARPEDQVQSAAPAGGRDKGRAVRLLI